MVLHSKKTIFKPDRVTLWCHIRLTPGRPDANPVFDRRSYRNAPMGCNINTTRHSFFSIIRRNKMQQKLVVRVCPHPHQPANPRRPIFGWPFGLWLTASAMQNYHHTNHDDLEESCLRDGSLGANFAFSCGHISPVCYAASKLKTLQLNDMPYRRRSGRDRVKNLPSPSLVNRESAPSRARRLGVQFDVGKLSLGS